MTGEHIVSAGLFPNDVVCVQGLDWCKDAPVTVGLANVKRKILCKHHNEIQSAVDDAAIAAFEAFRESVRLTNARVQMPERRWTISRLTIDGSLLERWFLKTLINVTVGVGLKIGPNSKVSGEPSSDLVEIAYGRRKFVSNAGLYYSAEAGETITSEDRVTIIPFFDDKKEFVLGGTFYFRGYRFMLILLDVGFTGRVTFIHGDGRNSSRYPQPLRHLKQMKATVGPSRKYVSHIIDFNWD